MEDSSVCVQVQERDKWWVIVNMVENLLVPQNAWNFLTN